jgi:hypothetical protein
MPLPDGNIEWPPKTCQKVNEQLAVWAAWWTGDPNQLAAIYGGGLTPSGATESTEYRFGRLSKAVDRVRRWFWSSSTARTQQRTRLHVPLAGDIAAASADLLFSEPPRVTADPDGPDGQPVDEAAQARLDLLWQDDTHAVLLEAAEICAAMGGVYLRIVWGPDRPYPWITAVQPDVAVPEWKWGSLSAVTFWRELGRDGRTVWRHLERHEPGWVWHGLYEGTVDELGRPMPLTERPETAPLASDRLVDGQGLRTGTDRLTAVYVPNTRPNRIWRTMPDAVHLGRPDIAGCEPLLDALDLTYSSLVRDIDLGKARLVVPREYMQNLGPGQGATVDLDQELYEAVNAMAAEGGDKIQIEQVQFAIRVQEHQQAIDALKRDIIQSAGYSPGTLGSGAQDGQAVTATEINSRDRKSLITRERKIRYWRSALADLLETWTHVDAAVYGSGIRPQRPQIEWPDAVKIDPLTQAQIIQYLSAADAISTWEMVRLRNPDWTDEQVEAEVARIRGDRPAPVEIGPALGALAGNEDQAAEPEE